MSGEGVAYWAAVERWKMADRSDPIAMRAASARLLSAEVAFEQTAEGRSFFSAPLAPVGAVSLAGEAPAAGPAEADFDRFELEVGLRRSAPVVPAAAGGTGDVSEAQLDAFERSLGLK